MYTVTDKDFSAELIESIDLSKFSNTLTLREKAFADFKKIGIPKTESEEYKFTPISRILTKHFQPSELVTPALGNIAKVKKYIPEEFSGNVIVLVNGVFNHRLTQISDQSGIIIKSLNEVLEAEPSPVTENFAKTESTDPFALLNTSLWQDGVFIHVTKDTKGKMPLLIHHLNDAGITQSATHTRLLINIDKNASLSIIEKTSSVGDQVIFSTLTEEITVEENATFNYYKVQDDAGRLIQVVNTTIKQKNSSRINTYTFSLDGKLIRNNLNILVDGTGCESHFYGLYLTNGDILVDNHTVVDHKQPNSYSHELYKGLMEGKSKGVFNGKIFVRPQAQKTNAFQSNRNILLSETASVNTKPQLEIWADDVKCSHGCTTGQLDNEALLYLRSRGIPKSTAKAMLLYAFVGEVIEAVTDPQIKKYIDAMVSERLYKGF